MAKGSEPFTWKLFPGIDKTCCVCHRELRVKDVGEHRTYIHYENGRGYAQPTLLWCHEHRAGANVNPKETAQCPA